MIAGLAAAMFAGTAITSAAMANETVWTCGPIAAAGANNVWVAAPISGISATNGCKSGYGLDIHAGTAAVKQGQSASWLATAPAGLMIVLAYVPPRQLRQNGVNDGNSGYGGASSGTVGGPRSPTAITKPALARPACGRTGSASSWSAGPPRRAQDRSRAMPTSRSTTSAFRSRRLRLRRSPQVASMRPLAGFAARGR